MKKGRKNYPLVKPSFCSFVISIILILNLSIAIPSQIPTSHSVFATSDDEDSHEEETGGSKVEQQEGVEGGEQDTASPQIQQGFTGTEQPPSGLDPLPPPPVGGPSREPVPPRDFDPQQEQELPSGLADKLQPEPEIVIVPPEICDDGIDNDEDGLIDGQDRVDCPTIGVQQAPSFDLGKLTPP